MAQSIAMRQSQQTLSSLSASRRELGLMTSRHPRVLRPVPAATPVVFTFLTAIATPFEHDE
jgi:hypothetical protein